MNILPIEAAVPALREALSLHRNAVLVAQPGAGKTTRVPIALLEETWLAGKKIVMLEPRRLAARSAARYMASTLGEKVGETVGYRVRMDSKIGPSTRIEVITEGVLTRLLQHDQALEGVGLVIFDEFHERSLHADLGLALCLESQTVLRDDLKLLVMSATIEAEPVAELLGGAPVLKSEGRAYPVRTVYAERTPEGKIESAVARTVLKALEQEEGDLLVFLPGSAEIRRTERLLVAAGLPDHVQIAPLYGNLSQEAQDRAIAPAEPGVRKVVLATSIAETSLTVEGVRVVIDCGLSRVSRFSPRTGMSRLETVPVSRASADQRRGRAGRVAPGVCYRLWTEQEERRLPAQSAPEIAEADLAPLALELAAWGVAAPAELAWLDAPPAAAYEQARELLRQLGALSGAGSLTPHGRRMAGLGTHPRLAHLLLEAERLGCGALGCDLAAVLSEPAALRGVPGAGSADLRQRVEALRSLSRAGGARGADMAAARRVAAEAAVWRRELGIRADSAAGSTEKTGLLLAFAYPDRIAASRGSGRFTMRSGRGAAFAEPDLLAGEPFLVIAESDDAGADGRIYAAAPISFAELEDYFADQMDNDIQVYWDRGTQTVKARRTVRLGALRLKEAPHPKPDPERVAQALLQGIAEEGLELLPWSRQSRQLQHRLQCMHSRDTRWPDMSDEALLQTAEQWLLPHLLGKRSRDDLHKLNMSSILESSLSWEQRRQLDEQAPTHLTVPSGSRIPIDYSEPAAPFVAVKLQEMFGLTETPRIAGGKLPLTLHLLSPAQRPVQVTQDLANFWRSTYFEVKKDLKGRYPKHYWPDDPFDAVATSRVRPRT